MVVDSPALVYAAWSQPPRHLHDSLPVELVMPQQAAHLSDGSKSGTLGCRRGNKSRGESFQRFWWQCCCQRPRAPCFGQAHFRVAGSCVESGTRTERSVLIFLLWSRENLDVPALILLVVG